MKTEIACLIHNIGARRLGIDRAPNCFVTRYAQILGSLVSVITCLMHAPSANAQDQPQPVSKLQVTTGSTTITLMAMPKSGLIGTIASHRRKLEQIIGDAAASGALTQDQKMELKAELDRIASEEATVSAQATKSANSKVIGLARSLDDVGFKLNSMLKKQVVLPLVQGSHFAVGSGDWIDIDDVAMRRWDLEGRIAKLVADGVMNMETASELRKQMDAIGDRESRMRSDGDLDYKESRILYSDFDRIAGQIEKLSRHGTKRR